jgi:hypothetical protein
MKLRVNLLRDHEARYQGPVSLRFALIAGGSTIGTILLILIMVAVHRHISTGHSLAFARSEWQRIEPQFKAVQKKQQQLRERQALRAELELWHSTRVDWHVALRQLQAIVPPTVQLTRMNLAGTWDFVVAPAPPDNPDKKSPPVPARRFAVNLSGSAAGEMADETVVQFTRVIRDTVGLRGIFDTVRLQRMSREAGGDDQAGDRVFEIEITSPPRKLQ